MNQWQVVSLVALAAWLLLAVNGYRARGVPAGRTALIAVVWLGIFGIVALLFAVLLA